MGGAPTGRKGRVMHEHGDGDKRKPTTRRSRTKAATGKKAGSSPNARDTMTGMPGMSGMDSDPGDVPDPTAPENLERPCGRGLLLIRYYMTDVSFDQRGSTIFMYKLRNGAK